MSIKPFSIVTKLCSKSHDLALEAHHKTQNLRHRKNASIHKERSTKSDYDPIMDSARYCHTLSVSHPLDRRAAVSPDCGG